MNVISLFPVLLILCLPVVQNNVNLLIPEEEINVDQFLDLHSSYNRYAMEKRNNFTTLAYLTPWNKHGYTVAQIFATKFDILAPVWFQVFGRKKNFAVAGANQIDKAWLADVQKGNPRVKITPRFHFDGWDGVEFQETFTSPQLTKLCISQIVKTIQMGKFDGAVIELWSQFFGASEKDLVDFVVQLGQTMREHNLLTILVIPPPVYNGGIQGRFSSKHLNLLASHVDFFSLMTYDFSHPSRPGPNSPLDWVAQCVKLLVPDDTPDLGRRRSQLLTGFNFYGMHYTVGAANAGEPILGHQFVELVNATRANFIWDKTAAEHYLRFNDNRGREHVVYYPTHMSIARRLSLINELGTGMSIWEIGQGLDSFYPLL